MSWMFAMVLGCSSGVAFIKACLVARKIFMRPVKRTISFCFGCRMIHANYFGVFVIWPQTSTGDVETEEVQVLLVVGGLPHVDGEADVV